MRLPQIDLTIDDNGEPMVVVDDTQDFTDLSTLFAAVPALTEPDCAGPAAQAVNHLSEGFSFGVILDPVAFAEAYWARYESEEVAAWTEGQPRLRDFGRPDLSELALPSVEDGRLIFYADDKYLGLAYKVILAFANPVADYKPLPMGQ